MKGIKSIIYEMNGQTLVIDLCEKSQMKYKNISRIIREEKAFEYLKNLFCIIDTWNEEYIDTKTIDGCYWKLSILYSNGNKKEYRGKASYPNNFEAFERLNQKLIDEVQNGQFKD